MAHLRSWDHGPSDQNPVVFLHAFPLHSGMWEDARLALGETTRVMGFDVRGLGESPLGENACLLEHWVDDLFAVLDEHHAQKATLVGLSLGGYIALRAIERQPERISGLFLADTQAAADTNQAKEKRAAGIRQLEAHGVAPYVEGFLKGALAPSTLENRPEIVERCRALTIEQSVQGLTAALVGLATRGDCSESLSRIAVPTRVVVGAHDAITSVATMRAMAEQIPNADLHVIPDAGHLSNLENPEAFNRLLVEHVGRVSPR